MKKVLYRFPFRCIDIGDISGLRRLLEQVQERAALGAEFGLGPCPPVGTGYRRLPGYPFRQQLGFMLLHNGWDLRHRNRSTSQFKICVSITLRETPVAGKSGVKQLYVNAQ